MDVTQREDIERLLAAGPRAAFGPALARLYETRQGRARKRHLATALGLTATAVIVAAALEHMNAPALYMRHLELRAAVVLLCAVGAVLVLRVRPGIREVAAYGVPLVGQVILSAWTGASGPPDVVDRSIVMCLILFAVLCAVPPLQVAAARSLAAIWLASFTATLWLYVGSREFSHHLPALGVGAVAMAIAVVLATRREAGRRRDFLHTLHAELTAAELRRMNAELERLMNTDVLTGVANRRQFESHMRALWQSRLQDTGEVAAIGLILADVDHFKPFNDFAGHAEGDACLKAIAEAISGVVRDAASSVARWGGEEFVVLAPAIARADLKGLAERIRVAVEALAIPHPAMPGRCVTVSVGGAWCGSGAPCDTPEALLRDADRALYAAKAAGRNRVMIALAPPASAAA